MTREDARDALWSNGHGDSNWIIDQIFNDHEAQLKAKEKHLKLLEQEYCLMKGKYSKANAKARSIVAMLFWEWRKYNSNFKNEENGFIQGRASKTKELFYKSYKMLKKQ